jgi:hypothetical protein
VKFTGQVRVPEIDHPGVPATVMVEDDQIEVFLEGESLGRWSLFDVHASRLVSAAFSISLDEEEITFIADEPVDFAYKGVDHMAEVWARYKSMAMPRRVVAVGRSRRGTKPSRVAELREAMLQNLEATGRIPPRLTPIERLRQVMAPHPLEPLSDEETLGEVTFDRPQPAPRAPSEPAFFPAPVEEPAALAPVEEEEPAAFAPVEEEQAAPSSPTPPRLRPGAGLLARRITPPEEPEPATSIEPMFAPPKETVSRFRSPWDEPAPPTEEAVPEPVLAEPFVPEPEPLLPEQEPFVPEPFVPEPAPTFEEPAAPEPEAVPMAAAQAPEVPELVKELLGTSSDEGGEEAARDLVVDLGDYEGRSSKPPEPEEGRVDAPAAPKQPVLTGASAEPTERSGLLGAVRSAFARNKVQHEHEFVEAPGGIGIVRQICAECGYISIGVSD